MLNRFSIVDDLFDLFDKLREEIGRDKRRFLDILDLFVIFLDETLVEEVRDVVRSEALFFDVFLILLGYYSRFSIFN